MLVDIVSAPVQIVRAITSYLWPPDRFYCVLYGAFRLVPLSIPAIILKEYVNIFADGF